MSTFATIRVGVTRTTISGGTLLRRPNSSARSAPMYRPPILVAQFSRSTGSSEVRAVPAIVTKLNGALIVPAQRHPGIAQDRPALDRVSPSREDHLITIKIHPDRRDMRRAVRPDDAEFGRARRSLEHE